MIQNVFISTFLALVLFAPSVHADSGQYGQYGQYGAPAPQESIYVDKQVAKPAFVTKGGVVTLEYVENLFPSDIRFKPGAEVNFKIRVKNTSTVTLSNVKITDTVPAYIEPIEGPGSYNAATRTVTVDVGQLAPNQEREYTLKTQLYGQDKLPADKGLFCAVNHVKATAGSASDDDTAQFCVEKEVIGVTQAPKAGPEMGLLLIAGQFGLLGLGMRLSKKA